jgi:hypothetical protein
MLGRRSVLAVVALLAVACGSSRLLLGHPVTAPLSILVRVAPDVANNDDGGGIAAMADAMLEALRQRGIVATIYAAPDEHPPPPRIEVWVSGFDAGSSSARRGGQMGAATGAAAGVPAIGLAGAVVNLAGSGSLKVECLVYEEDNFDASYDHVYEYRILGDEDAATNAGESLGEQIINDVFRGEPVARRSSR